MTTEQTETLIMKRLDTLLDGQSVMNGELKTLASQINEQDKRHCDQIRDIKDDIKKGYEGRSVLHKKQDDLEKEINDIKPTIKRVDGVFGNIGKILWGLVAVVLIGILISSLPAIIEVLK